MRRKGEAYGGFREGHGEGEEIRGGTGELRRLEGEGYGERGEMQEAGEGNGRYREVRRG